MSKLVDKFIIFFIVTVIVISVIKTLTTSEVIEVSGGHTTNMMKAIIIETPFGTELSNLIINICNSTGLTENLMEEKNLLIKYWSEDISTYID